MDHGLFDQVTQVFLRALQHDSHLLQMAARHVFESLVVIQLALTALMMVLAGESLQRFFVRLVGLFCTFGVFYTLVNESGYWVPALLNGFIEIGQKAGVTALDPSSMINQGLSIAGGIFKAFFNWGVLGHPFVSLIGGAICLAIVVLYALMAAELTIILVKTYVVIALGNLFFAFGGLECTRPMSVHYIKAAIGLGLQLLTLYVLLGVGQNMGAQWVVLTQQAATHHALMPMFVILAAVIVYYLLLKNIPPFIAGFSGVGGFRNYGDAAVATALNTGVNSMNFLQNNARRAGRMAQAGSELITAGGHVSKLFTGAFTKHGKNLSGLGRAAQSTTAQVSGAMANTLKNSVMRQQSHLSAGQKLNQHLANRVSNAKE
ncbi:MAG: P-type conjugative transfer protein TrbL [Gammaproteobacteria bacterium]|nr:P-type conjugative transfer protein TrbL [Gammaproteobacteria bacterium]